MLAKEARDIVNQTHSAKNILFYQIKLYAMREQYSMAFQPKLNSSVTQELQALGYTVEHVKDYAGYEYSIIDWKEK